MTRIPRRTLKGDCAFSGVGIHSGAPCGCRLVPASEGGRRFRLGGVEIAAHARHISRSAYGLCLAKDGASVGVVEHLLAVLSAFQISDIIIDISGPELPIMDGSAAAFAETVAQIGTIELVGENPPLVIERMIEVSDGARKLRLEPYDGFAIDCTIDFAHPAIGRARYTGDIDSGMFLRELAHARSFGFASDADSLRAAGLAGGASLDTALIFDDAGPLNPGGMRWADEPLRHKVLDLIGDFALVGRPLRAKIVAERPGHSLSAALMRKASKSGLLG